jgi:hypothetical protein
MKRKRDRRAYIRASILSIEEAFEILKKNNPTTWIHGVECSTSLESLRLRTFMLKGIKCTGESCTLEGSFFAVERSPGGVGKYNRFHLNLYAFNEHNQEVLFTHDHICARSLKGTDTLDNSRTMCKRCNERKAKYELKVKQALIERPKYKLLAASGSA